MSTTVDNRVLEMRFDNKQFERGVATSMSTLEKFKQKLNLSGAAKGLESISSATRKFKMDGMTAEINTVQASFSAMQVAGVTAIANITNSIVDSGKKMAKALTIDPVKSGFQEYETQINAVQTILANTSSKGTTLDQVNAALDELNKYADLTIYNFTEMTRNIGTFTAAGVDLDTSVSAIQGIANLAAVSGSTSQQASTAMYQLSQALAAGRISLMDWNSVVNAGMGGQVFQDALKKTSELLGTGAEAAIEAKGSFRESLQEGWLTADVLTETLKKMTTSGAKEYVAEYTGMSLDAVEASLKNAEAQYGEAEAIEYAAKELAEKSGKSEDEIKSTLKMAKTAEDAATKVKTFTQLWDTLQEAAQSGWTQTWELIVGDFEEAKEFLTELSDKFGEIINKSAESRNTLLEGALTSSWDKMIKKINEAGVETGVLEENIRKIATDRGYDIEGLTEKYGTLEKAFQNGAISSDILNKALMSLAMGTADLSKVTGNLNYGDAGEGVKQVQQALQELGYDFGKFGMDGVLGDETAAAIKAFQEANNLEVTGIIDQSTLDKIRELSGETKDLTSICGEFIDEIDKIGGRELLLDSFMNALNGVLKVANTVKGAWRSIFPAATSDQLYSIIEGVNKFSQSLIMNQKTMFELKRTFKGLFAALDIVRMIAGGGLTVAFEVLKQVLAAFDMDILGCTASIGDAIVKFRNWLKTNNLITKAVQTAVPAIVKMGKAIANWIQSLVKLPSVQGGLDKVSGFFDDISERIGRFIDLVNGLESISLDGVANAFKEAFDLERLLESAPGDLIAGFANGIRAGVSEAVGAVMDLASQILAGFRDVLGIHSPSTETYADGKNFVLGFVNSIKEFISLATGKAKELGSDIVEAFREFDWGSVDWSKIFAGGAVVGLIAVAKKIADAAEVIASPLNGLGDALSSISNIADKAAKPIAKVITNFSKIEKSFSKLLKGIAFEHKAEGVKQLAISLAILVGAIIILTYVNTDKLWNAVGVVGALAAILLALAFAMDRMEKASLVFDGKSKSLNIKGLSNGLLGIATAILMIAATVKIIGGMNAGQLAQGFLGLAGVVGAIVVIMTAFGAISKTGASKHINKLGGILLKMSIAMLLMVKVVKLAAGIGLNEALKGAAFITAFVFFVAAITKVTKIGKKDEIAKVGGLLIKMAFAMALMVGVCKLAGALSSEELLKGAAFAAAFVVFTKFLTDIAKTNKGQKIAKLGGLVASISFAMMLMVGVCKLIGLLSVNEMIKGGIFAAAFLVFVKGIAKVATLDKGQKTAKLATTILAISVAMGILAGLCMLLGMIDITSLAKGLAAVGVLGLVMAAMVKALKGANNVKGSIIAMTVAIGVLVGAIVLLSFLDPAKLVGPTAALVALMGMFAILMKCSGKADVSIKSVAIMLGVVAILTALLYLLGSLDVGPTKEITKSLCRLLISFATAMKLIGKAGKISKRAMVAMGVLTLVVGTLGLILVGLTKLNPGPALEMALAISAVLIAMSTAALILSKIGPMASAGIGGATAFLALAVAAGAIMGALGGLVAQFEGAQEFLESGIPIMEAIGNNLGAFIGGIIGGIGEGITGSLPEMARDISMFMAQLSVAAAIGKTIQTGSFDCVKDFLDIMGEIAVSTVDTTISDIFTLGGTSMDKFKKDGVAFFGAMKDIMESASGITVDQAAFDSIIAAAESLTTLQEKIEPIYGISSIFLGFDDLGTFGENAKSFIKKMTEGLNALSELEYDEEEKQALQDVIDAATDLSEFQKTLNPIGGKIKGIIEGKDDLATFSENAGTFMNSMKKTLSALCVDFNYGIAEWVALQKIILASTQLSNLQNGLKPMGGLISWFNEGPSDLGTFGSKIEDFVGSMITAIGALSAESFTFGIAEQDALDKIIDAADRMAGLQNSLKPMEEVIGFFQTKRDQNLETFGKNAGEFIKSMAQATQDLGTSTFNAEALDSVIEAADRLSALEASLTPMGSVISWFSEEGIQQSLGDFGGNVETFANALGTLKDNLGQTGISEEVIASIKNTGEMLNEFQTNLPSYDDLTDLQTWGEFSSYAKVFGEALGTLVEGTTNIDDSKIDTAMSLAYRMKAFISVISGLDGSNVKAFAGKGGFGSSDGWMITIGEGIGAYSNAVSGIDSTAVSKSIAAAYKLKRFIEGLGDYNDESVEEFDPSAIATAIGTYYENMSGVNMDAVTQSIAAANTLKDFISGLSSLDTTGVDAFTGALSTLGSTDFSTVTSSLEGATSDFSTVGSGMADSIQKGFSDNQSGITTTVSSTISSALKEVTGKAEAFRTAGAALASKLLTGLKSYNDQISTALSSAISSAASSIRGYWDSFYEAGKYLGSGLVSGINQKKDDAYDAGYRLGQAAVQGEKDGQQSHSPSKLTIKAGKWLGEGLVIGMNALGRKVYDTGYSLGDTAAKSMSSVVSRVSDFIDSGMDVQPTIRPVLDLTDVKSGAGIIDGLFARDPLVGVRANVNAINTAMSRRNQNGRNDDVVSAIDKLNKNLGKVGNTSYSINGISYNDDSAVSDAIQTLVRAVIVEGRS